MIKRLALFTFIALVGSVAGAVQPAPSTDIGALIYWDPNPETDIAGYTIYSGKASGSYDSTISIQPDEKKEIDGGPKQFKELRLPLGETHFFVVTATNEAGLESLPSNEVAITTPSAPESPAFPVILLINEDGSIQQLKPSQIITE